MKQRKILLPKTVFLFISKKKNSVLIKGPLGQLELDLPKGIYLKCLPGRLFYESLDTANFWEASFYDILKKIIKGVSRGFTQHLNLVGVGYRSLDLVNNKLYLNLGRSFPDQIQLPDHIKIVCPKPNIILLKSYDFLSLSQNAHKIQNLRPPESYKRKGIFFKNQVRILKSGKLFK